MPYLHPISMKAPETAPHVSCSRPIPPPNPQAIRRASRSEMPKPAAWAEKTACAQLKPDLKTSTADSLLLFIRTSNHAGAACKIARERAYVVGGRSAAPAQDTSPGQSASPHSEREGGRIHVKLSSPFDQLGFARIGLSHNRHFCCLRQNSYDFRHLNRINISAIGANRVRAFFCQAGCAIDGGVPHYGPSAVLFGAE